MDGISFRISGSLLGPLEQMQKELPRAEKRALYRAAYFLRDKIRQSLVSSVPKAETHSPKYTSININAMGSRKKGSGTYRTRFFENDTKDRYQKTYRGIKLKKKRFLGHITGTHFFSNAVSQNESQAVNLMRDVISEYVRECYN